jgi:BON domain-containing protein
MAGLWKILPIGRATAAWWAWKNRRELGRWAGFVWRTVPPSSAGRADVLAEGRLRAALAKDPRTRGVPSLAVRVANGTAFLEGHLSPDLHDLVASVTRTTKGVRLVECRIRDKGARHGPMSHAHTIAVAAVPPRPA